MPSIPLTAQQIENNKKNAPQLPDHIKPYEEMGYDWEQAHGPKFWMYQGKSLRDLRYERE